jgi:hypothetical protein
MSFKIGEVVILVYSEINPERIGTECEILSGPCKHKIHASCGGGYRYGYEVRGDGWGNGITGKNEWFCSPSQLKRKPPPSNSKGEPRLDFVPANEDDWINIGWSPNRQRVTP